MRRGKSLCGPFSRVLSVSLFYSESRKRRKATSSNRRPLAGVATHATSPHLSCPHTTHWPLFLSTSSFPRLHYQHHRVALVRRQPTKASDPPLSPSHFISKRQLYTLCTYTCRSLSKEDEIWLYSTSVLSSLALYLKALRYCRICGDFLCVSRATENSSTVLLIRACLSILFFLEQNGLFISRRLSSFIIAFF